jgi:hypothetical protein
MTLFYEFAGGDLKLLGEFVAPTVGWTRASGVSEDGRMRRCRLLGLGLCKPSQCVERQVGNGAVKQRVSRKKEK